MFSFPLDFDFKVNINPTDFQMILYNVVYSQLFINLAE